MSSDFCVKCDQRFSAYCQPCVDATVHRTCDDMLAEIERLHGERNEARELLANVFDRFACAACSHGKTGPDCPCGFHAAGAYLDRTEEP